jgi:hypothetical protein
MARNGSGTYSLLTNSWNPSVNGTPATAADWQSLINDVASAITQSISKDGQTPYTGNQPMGSNKLTGLSAGTAAGDSLRYEQLFSQGTPTNIASASTVDIGAQLTCLLNVTGTTTITSFGTNYNGPRFLRFAGALTLTHNATTLILPGGANITTDAGDSLIAVPKGSPADGWAVISYERASPNQVISGNLTVNGNTTLGDSASDTVVVNGNMGIGTSSPAYKLDVSGTSRFSGGIGVGTIPAQYGGLIDLYTNDNSVNAGIWVRNDNAGSSAKAGIVLNASGNSWRMSMGSAANNSNALTWEVDVIAPTTLMTLSTSGNLLLTAGTGALGYGTGAGGTVTQATSRTTGVTLNKPCGSITMFSAAGSTTAASFTVTNSLVAATDTVVLSVRSGTNKYRADVTAIGAGSFEITFATTGGTSTDAPVINFTVIKGATS